MHDYAGELAIFVRLAAHTFLEGAEGSVIMCSIFCTTIYIFITTDLKLSAIKLAFKR